MKKTREDRKDKVVPTQHVSADTEEGHLIASADLGSEPCGQQLTQFGEPAEGLGLEHKQVTDQIEKQLTATVQGNLETFKNSGEIHLARSKKSEITAKDQKQELRPHFNWGGFNTSQDFTPCTIQRGFYDCLSCST